MSDDTRTGETGSTVIPLKLDSIKRDPSRADVPSPSGLSSPPSGSLPGPEAPAVTVPSSPVSGTTDTAPAPSAPLPGAAPTSRAPVLFGWLLTFGWLAAGAAYVQTGPGLPVLLAEPPLTLAALSAVAVLPLLALWFLVVLADRSASFRSEAVALRQHLSLLTYPGDADQTRFNRISEALKIQTRDLSTATQEAATQADALRTILSEETRELARIAHDVSTDAAPTLGRIAHEVKAMTDLMERVAFLTKEAEATLSTRHETLDSLLTRADTTTDRLATLLDRHNASLSGLNEDLGRRTVELDTLSQRHDAALSATRSTAEAFERSASALTAGAQIAVEEVGHQAGQLTTTLSVLTEQTSAFGTLAGGLSQQLDDFNEGLMRRSETLEDRSRRITEAAHTAAQELDAATAAALGDFNAFRDVATDALEGAQLAAAAIRDTSQQGEGVRRLLQAQARGLEDAVRALGEEVHKVAQACTDESQSVAQVSERASERIRHLSDLLARSAVDITRTTARAAVEIETVTESVKQGASQIAGATHDIRDAARTVSSEADVVAHHIHDAANGMLLSIQALNETGDAFTIEAGHITHAARETAEAIKALAEDLRAEADQFGMVTGHAIERADTLRIGLNAVLTDFEQAVDAGTERVQKAGATLHEGMDRFAQSARSTMEALTSAGGALRAQVDGMNLLTEETEDKLSRLNRAMEDGQAALAQAGARATDNALRAGAEFGRQAESLHSAAKAAEQQVRTMESLRDSLDLQRFLTETSYVIEKLQAAAVDITRLFTPAVEEDLWKRYYKGEHNIFLTHAAKTITRSQSNAVKKLYAENREFRQYASRYISEYEVLMKAARDNDRGDVVSAVFASSDMGRLYAVLARSVGRMGGE